MQQSSTRQPVEQQLASALTEGNHCLALAESCSGGLMAHRVTRVPGSSAFFDCGLVVYSDRAKTDLLAVSPALLAEHGAVSSACARAMLEGLFSRTPATIAAAVTGIAGPTGATPGKPLGTVYLAWGTRGIRHVQRYRFSGDRHAVMEATAEEGLQLLLQQVRPAP